MSKMDIWFIQFEVQIQKLCCSKDRNVGWAAKNPCQTPQISSQRPRYLPKDPYKIQIQAYNKIKGWKTSEGSHKYIHQPDKPTHVLINNHLRQNIPDIHNKAVDPTARSEKLYVSGLV